MPNDVAFVLSILVSAAFGYAIREIIAGLQAEPPDLQNVLEAYHTIDRVNAAHRAGYPDIEADFPESGNALGVAIVRAAERRGMRRGQLLGFVAGAK